MEKTNIINDILNRVTSIEKSLKGNKKSGKEDEDVCPKCGGDLLFVEEGVVYCAKCKDYYTEEKEGTE